ncbi:Subtilase family protein [Amycolatopsis arida]|uniref:Subtilase family protein n=1 Tax=Amycolatopsis arida TaxID=587909 RepID=A0A1I5WTP1_9PSEU|nr:S8 family serine peptidase [Amycolatopsis arida]TDX92448.1 subtilase family protein [Amycolatopsis arida]SFQ23125.1 Subtilase family protein [Amycolatopsis arida]
MFRTRRWLPAVTAVALGASGVLTAPVAAAEPAAAACDPTSPRYTYVVIYQPHTPEPRVTDELRRHCGERVAYYREIGVAVAASRDADFAERIGVFRAYSGEREIAEPPTTAAASARAAARAAADKEVERTTEVAATQDLSAQQWDMRAIKAPEANAVNPGSKAVTVGVVDSGIEPTHPALVASLRPEVSAGCVTGAADPSPAAWVPTTSDHGTHVAGTIAGRDPATGFTGVAPGVRMASVKVVNDEGYIYPESAVCGLMWSAKHRFQVNNHSYYIDPGMFYCPRQPGDAAAYEAVRRALRYSTDRGVLNVAAAGNSNFDLANPTFDPNRPHEVDASCKILPKGIEGVVTVSAVGYAGTKSSYSNYGLRQVTVTAPGGDRAQVPPQGEGPACPLSTILAGGYGAKCGTSMASPHAAGVAALLASRYRHAPPWALRALLGAQADPVPCGDAANCTGPDRNNSFYGKGLVNALDAVR